MPRLLNKFVISFLTSLVFLFSFGNFFEAMAAPSTSSNTTSTTTSPSDGTWYNQNFFDWYGKVYDTQNSDQIFGERYTAAQVQWVIYGLISYLFNITGDQDLLVCAIKGAADLSACTAAVQKIFNLSKADQNSMVAIKNQSLISMVFADRPLSGIGYTKKLVKKFDLVPTAYAASSSVGFGFDALLPIQPMWTGARNMAFGFFVLASIIFAFMIMFRVKISPQVVISVQSAIPKLVTALILVTFSYAIAGFLIDFMYVVIGLASILLSSFSNNLLNPSQIFNILTMGQPAGGVQIGVLGFLMILAMPLLVGLGLLVILVIVLGGATFAIGGFMFWILLIPLIIAIVAVLWISFKTIWGLLKAFASIILLTVFAPLQIALGVLVPNFGFGTWVKNYLSQLSIFVVTGVMGYLSILFTVQGILIGLKDVNGGTNLGLEILKPILGAVSAGTFPTWAINSSPWPPLLGAGNGMWIGLLFLGVSFVLFTLIPKSAEIVQGFISGKPYAYGTAIGEVVNMFGVVPTAKKAGEQFASNLIYNPRGEGNDLVGYIGGRISGATKGSGTVGTSSSGPRRP